VDPQEENMIPKAAIEKSMDGGWHYGKDITVYAREGIVLTSPDGFTYVATFAEIALERLFWLALGKAKGIDGIFYGKMFCHIVLSGGDRTEHRERCHHKDEPGEHGSHMKDVRCRCICTCPNPIAQFWKDIV
jgi:hypothetical protein